VSAWFYLVPSCRQLPLELGDLAFLSSDLIVASIHVARRVRLESAFLLGFKRAIGDLILAQAIVVGHWNQVEFLDSLQTVI